MQIKPLIDRLLPMIFLLMASITFYSCSSNEDSAEPANIEIKEVVLDNFNTEGEETGIQKAMQYIEKYNKENDIYSRHTITTFITKINDCSAKITQTVIPSSDYISQEVESYCRIHTHYVDDYLLQPDYLSRHYITQLIVGQQELLSSATRKYADGEWGRWYYSKDLYTKSKNHSKNIAFFGGSFAHNLRENIKGINNFGFDYNGNTTSILDLVSETYAAKHSSNYAQSGQGVYTGKLKELGDSPVFPYNVYEQLKYAISHSTENGYKYDIFLLFGGINDSQHHVPIGDINDKAGNTSYIASYKQAIEYIKDNASDAEIYMLSSFPVFNEFYSNPLKEYVDANIQIADYYNIPILDIYNSGIFTYANFRPYYLYDNVHPNGEGYRVVSPLIIDFLAQ